MHGASGWNNRGGVDGRHPDTDFVLLEQVGNQLVEVDVRLSVVVVCQLVVIAALVSTTLEERKETTYA